jgi:hypothetical protein
MWFRLKMSSSLGERLLFKLVRNPKIPKRAVTVINGTR